MKCCKTILTKNMKTNFLKTILFIATTVVLISCDKDFNNIGEDIIGDEHYGLDKYTGQLTVNAYTKTTGPIQTNNLDVNPLGIYDNPVFGKTTASFVTQVQLASVAPSLPALTPTSTALGALKSRTVTKVTLYIPYFSKITGTKTSGGTYDYALDSIVNYEDRDNKIKLSIFENNRFMGSADTSNSLLTPYLFYSNNTDSNNNSISAPIGTRLNEDSTDPTNFPLSNNDEFKFSLDEIKVPATTIGGIDTYKAPGMNLRLRNSYFNTKILLADADKLKTNAAFTEYFRGLYFKVEQSGTDRGCMNMLDFKKGTITIEYKETSNAATQPVNSSTDVVTDKTIVLNLTGNTASLLTNAAALPTYADRLTIKGGEGAVAMIDLFGQNLVAGNPSLDVKKYDRASNSVIAGSNGISDEVDYLKVKGWLINEANLTFYIDNESNPSYTGSGVMKNLLDTNGKPAVEPYRLFLYDARNKRPIIDYYYDGSTSLYPNSGKVVHGGIIDRKESTVTPTKRGVKYKIRITDHIRNLINKDSTNVTLGLSVCKTINNQYFSKQKSALNTNLNYFPTSSVMNPLGTIIWGTGTAVPVGKEMKLEIWYTKAN